MRHGFIDQSLLSRHPGMGPDAGTTGAAPRFEPFYSAAVRSGVWPLGPGFRREGTNDAGTLAHAR